MTRIYSRIVSEVFQLIFKRLEEIFRVTAVMAIASARIKQCVAAEQTGLVRSRQQANMAHRVPRRIEALQINSFADFYDVSRAHTAVYIGDLILGIRVSNNLRASRVHDSFISPGVIRMLVGIEQLSDRPATVRRDRESSGSGPEQCANNDNGR